MSLSLDLAAIRNRFLDQWDRDAVLTVFENAGDQFGPADPDEKEPFVRFSINPGSQAFAMGTGIYSQIGRVWLQVFIPANDGIAAGYALADQFTAIFRDWRSDDGCVRTSDAMVTQIPGGEDGYYQINISVKWESLRRL